MFFLTLCTLANTLREMLGETNEPCWQKLLYYNFGETRTDVEKKWIDALMFYNRAKLRPKTHTDLETALPEITDADREDRRRRGQDWINERLERIANRDEYIRQEEENVRANERTKERRPKAYVERRLTAIEDERKAEEERQQLIRDAREKTVCEKYTERVKKRKAFVIKHGNERGEIEEIAQLDKYGTKKAGWGELGYAKPMHSAKFANSNEIRDNIVEAMAA